MEAAVTLRVPLARLVRARAAAGCGIMPWRAATAAAASSFSPTTPRQLARFDGKRTLFYLPLGTSGRISLAAGSRGLAGVASPRGPPRNLNAANGLTVLRIAAAPLAARLILEDEHVLALITVAAAGVTDAVDGWIARRYAMRTTLGSYLDPLADKLLVACTAGALAVQGVLPIWLVGVVVTRDVIIVSMAAVQRWNGIPSASWKSMLSVSDLPPLVIQPLPISKLNTALQLILMVSSILHAGQFGLVSEDAVHMLCVATAATTVSSGGVYAYLHLRRVWPMRWKL
jgi:cardiolipin synthase (CMP-forming)